MTEPRPESSPTTEPASPSQGGQLLRVGAAAAAGLAGGCCCGLLGLIASRAATGPLAWLALTGLGGALGLGAGLCSLAVPPGEGPAALLGRWLRRGPVGAGDRAVGLLAAGLLLAQGLWLAGVWVDSTFHHKLLSASLLTAATLALLPVGLACARLVERLSGRLPEVALALLALLGVAFGLRLASSPSPGALQGPLALSSGLLAAASAWTLARPRRLACLTGLLVAPLAVLLPLLLAGADAGALLDSLQTTLAGWLQAAGPPAGVAE